MAEHEYEITLKWENGVACEMTSKKDNAPKFIVAKTDENNHIADTLDGITKAWQDYFKRVVKLIADEMIT